MAIGPVTDAERARIVELLESGMSYAKVAREVGRGQATIARAAKAGGFSAAQSAASRTRHARAARSAYSAEHRAIAAAGTQELADKIRETFFDKRQQVVQLYGRRGDGGGTEIVEVEPDAKAIADLAKALHTLQRTVLDIDRHDNRADEGAAAVDQWLRSVIGEAAA